MGFIIGQNVYYRGIKMDTDTKGGNGLYQEREGLKADFTRDSRIADTRYRSSGQ